MNDDLITKYRPRDWNEFVGNDVAVKSLMGSIDTRNAHAYLLTGPSGCGKTTAARIMAMELECAKPFELDAATSNSVDDVRGITEQLKYKSVLGDNMVFIIDECHMLSRNAWNAFLKAVEEPPAHVYWIFCTTEVSKVIDTVKTRCFKATFQPLDTDRLFDILMGIAREEGFETSDAILEVCAESASGSPRQAISNLAVCGTLKSVEDAYEALQSAGGNSDAVDLVKALIDNKPWPQLQAILNKLGETTAESIRRVIIAYLTKVILGMEREDKVARLFQILDAFGEPFRDEGLAPVVLAVGAVKFAR